MALAAVRAAAAGLAAGRGLRRPDRDRDGLLLLPFSSRSGESNLRVALFTATSAVCVTGLVVVDTGSYWSGFGQAVIVGLMEVGGLGFMIGVTSVILALRGRLSLLQRTTIQQTGTALGLGGQRLIIIRTLQVTFLCELAGVLLLWWRFAPRFGRGQGLWLGIFHSVSAFSNASFDLFGDFRSFADYREDAPVLLTIAALIVLGGLSVVTIEDIRRKRGWRRLSLDSKVILLGTPLLIVVGVALIYTTERLNPASLATLPLNAQILDSLFHSIAARSAGFSTWDLSQADQRTLFFLLGLMFIGAAPGSMAGGIKLTTAAAIAAAIWSALRSRQQVTLLNRSIPAAQVAQAVAVFFLALGLVFAMALLISLIEGARFRAPLRHDPAGGRYPVRAGAGPFPVAPEDPGTDRRPSRRPARTA